MKVLAIGNSFSVDATRYLPWIARSDGTELEVVTISIASCSLDMHYRNMLSGERAYKLLYNGQLTGFQISMQEALLSRKWDAVVLQQVSHLAPQKQTYYPYITPLADYVRKCAPEAKLLLQQTWAYEDGSDRLSRIAGYETSAAMLSDLVNSYQSVCAEQGFDGVIPSGELMADLLAHGIEKVHRDTFHASRGLGRYALGLLWYRMLTGKTVTEIPFRDLDVPESEADLALARQCVQAFSPLS